MSRIFFIDRDLGRHILPEALEAAGLAVERHDDHFEPDTPDEVWVPQVAAEGWVAVTGDQKLLRRPLAVAAIAKSCAIVLVLVGNHAPAPELATNLINTMLKVEILLAGLVPPAAAKIYRPTPKELLFEGKPGSVKKVPLPPPPHQP